MKKILILLSLIFAIKSHATAPHFPLKGNKDKLYFWSSTKYYTTTQNYDLSGSTFESLNTNNSLTSISQSLEGTMMFYPRFSVFSSLEFLWIETTNNSTNPTEAGIRTGTQFTDLKLGARYQIMRRPLYITPELSLSIPFNSYSTDTDGVLSGPGAMKIQAGAWFEKRYSIFHFYSLLGMTYQMDGFASFFDWKFGVKSFFLKTLQAGIGVSGYTPIIDDEFAQSPSSRSTILNKVNAGSLRYASVNPEEILANLWGGIRLFNKWYLILGLESSLTGTNTAKGNLYSFQIQWKADKGSKKKRRRKKKGKKVPKFIDTEDVDEPISPDISQDEEDVEKRFIPDNESELDTLSD